MLKFTILFAVNIFFFMFNTLAQQTFPLYEGKVPNNKDNIANTEKTEMGDDRVERIFDVSVPTLTMYTPVVKDPRGISVIICPGGGYFILSSDREGKEVAQALNDFGITAFVLKYRIPSNERNIDKSIAPLMDAQKAIETVRINAKKWGIDPQKIGIMGFSAGGNLAAAASNQFKNELIDNTKKISLRPNFSVLAYPVISMQDTLTHQGSKENLLKDARFNENRYYHSFTEAANFFSNEKNVTTQTPPTFIFHSMDDNAVNVENSIIYFNQLIKNKVKNCELIIYPSGGHGYALNLPNKNEKWIERLKNWLDILYP